MSLENILISLKGVAPRQSATSYYFPPSEDAAYLWLQIQEILDSRNIRFEVSNLEAWDFYVTSIFVGEYNLFLKYVDGVAKFYWCKSSVIKDVVYEDSLVAQIIYQRLRGGETPISLPKLSFGTQWDAHFCRGGLSLRAKQVHEKPILFSGDGDWFYREFLVPILKKNNTVLRSGVGDDDGVISFSLTPSGDFRI